MNKCPKCGHEWPDDKRAKGGKARWRGMTTSQRKRAASDAAKARCGGSGLTMAVVCGTCGEPPVAGSANGYEPPSELILFVRKQIAHKIGRHSWSREWSEGQIHDAASMIADYCKAHNT